MIIKQSIYEFWKPKMRTPWGWKSCYTTDPPPCQKKDPCLFSLKDGGRSEDLRGRACNRRSLHRPGFSFKSKKSGRGNCPPPLRLQRPLSCFRLNSSAISRRNDTHKLKEYGIFFASVCLCCRLLRGRSLTKLTKFCSILYTYLLPLLTL